jgi:alkanesulfonate monooxygenase SsuD/methylene tetrahydromethanopterin reductase-like flavin-dependent oxidoreductase (luciferase family)
VKIGFGVMVLALRGPAWAAKQVATLQALSGERVILGVGAGSDLHGTAAWDAIGVPITGNVNQAADRLAEYAAAGVSHLVVGLVGEDWPGQCDLLAQARAALSV